MYGIGTQRGRMYPWSLERRRLGWATYTQDDHKCASTEVKSASTRALVISKIDISLRRISHVCDEHDVAAHHHEASTTVSAPIRPYEIRPRFDEQRVLGPRDSWTVHYALSTMQQWQMLASLTKPDLPYCGH